MSPGHNGARRLAAALVIAALSCPCPPVGPGSAHAGAPASSLGVVLCEGEGYRLVRPRGDCWFSRAAYDERKESLRRRARGAGMPDDVIESTLPRIEQLSLSMEKGMLETADRFAYARLGLYFDKRAAIDIGAGAFTVKLRGSAGDSLLAPDNGLLAATGRRHDFRPLDTGRGSGRLTWDLQQPDFERTPFVVFLRLPAECRGMTVESVVVDPQRFVVRQD